MTFYLFIFFRHVAYPIRQAIQSMGPLPAITENSRSKFWTPKNPGSHFRWGLVKHRGRIYCTLDMGSPVYKSSPVKFAFYEIVSGSFGRIQVPNEINRSTIRDSITNSIRLPDRRKYNFFKHIGRYILIALYFNRIATSLLVSTT